MKKKILSAFVMAFCAGTSYANSELSNDTFTHAESIPVSTVVEHQTDLDIASVATVLPEAHSLKALSDDEMSQVEGQALMSLTTTKDAGQGLDFYRLGMEANIDINANLKKLQLGCGGVNSSISGKGGMCDIDIDNVSLTGITMSDAQGAGAGTDFKLTNPFIEFAVVDADKPSTRYVAGFRLGAMNALGMMSLGGNTNTSDLGDDYGINSFSGDIGVNVVNAKIRGVRIVGNLTGLTLATIDANVKPYTNTLIFERSSTLSLIGLEAVTSAISVLGLSLPLGLNLNANMNDIPFNTVHRLQVSDANGNPTSGAYLSLQSRDIRWQNTATKVWSPTPAKKGWWLSIPNTTFENLDIDGSSVRIKTTEAVSGILGSTIQFPGIDLGQRPVNNCYGSLKFC